MENRLVCGLTNLAVLALSDTRITDSGLKHVSGLTELEVLSIDRTNITDAGLHNLMGLNKLEVLNLRRTKVTDDGVSKLHRALPGCKILHRGGPKYHSRG